MPVVHSGAFWDNKFRDCCCDCTFFFLFLVVLVSQSFGVSVLYFPLRTTGITALVQPVGCGGKLHRSHASHTAGRQDTVCASGSLFHAHETINKTVIPPSAARGEETCQRGGGGRRDVSAPTTQHRGRSPSAYTTSVCVCVCVCMCVVCCVLCVVCCVCVCVCVWGGRHNQATDQVVAVAAGRTCSGRMRSSG